MSKPERIAEMVRRRVRCRATRANRFSSEDDDFEFGNPASNFVASVGERAPWGYFGFRMKDEGFNDGYGSVLVNLSSARARFFQAAGRSHGCKVVT